MSPCRWWPSGSSCPSPPWPCAWDASAGPSGRSSDAPPCPGHRPAPAAAPPPAPQAPAWNAAFALHLSSRGPWLLSLEPLVLGDGIFELGQHHVRVLADLAHPLGPDLHHGLGSLPPLGDLRVRDGVHLAPGGRVGLQLGDAGALE